MRISSSSHPLMKIARSLSSPKGRRRHRLVLVEGIRAAEGAVAAGAKPRAGFFTREALQAPRGAALAETLSRAGCAVYEIPQKLFKSISQVETPQGAAILCSLKTVSWADALKLEFVLVADGLQDPGNLGTVMRSAAAFGVEAVLLTRGTTDAGNPKALRASAGAWLAIPVCESLDSAGLGSGLAAAGFKIIVADPRGSTDFRKADYRGRTALVFGGEPRGPAAGLVERADLRIRIPTAPRVESLNVAAAAAVVLAQAACSRETVD